MDETAILGWIKVAEVAISVGVATADSIKGLFKAGGVSDDDAVLDRIVSEAAARKAAREAEAAMPDPPQA